MNSLSKDPNSLYYYTLITCQFFFIHTKNKPYHKVYKFQLIPNNFPNLHIVWKEGRNLSLPDLMSRSLTTTTQDDHRLKTVEIPDFIKFFMTHNRNTQPIQCHCAVSKENINTVSTDNTLD